MANLPVPGPQTLDWATTLNAFLRTEHNDDGTHTVAAAIGENYKATGHTAKQVSTTKFQIAGADHTGIYASGLMVQFNGNSAYEAAVVESEYIGGKWTYSRISSIRFSKP